MKAVKLFGKGALRVVDCDIPEIGDDELLVKTSSASVCGSDVRMIKNGYKGIDETHPLTLGHEMSGTIVKTGSAVTGYKTGERISIAPNYGCGICSACVSGNTHLCSSYRALGINIDGAFAEYVRIPAKAIAQGNVLKLGDAISWDEAAVIEPASCVLNGQEQTGIRLGDSVLIIGAGPIGLMHAMMAEINGAGAVYITDLNKERISLCTKAMKGLTGICSEELEKKVAEYTDGRGMDVCIVACPSAAAQEKALDYMGVNGRILYFGGLPEGKDVITLSSNIIHYKQLKICGSTRANTEQYRKTARLAETGRLDLKKVVTASYPLKDIDRAVKAIGDGKELKVVIHMG